MPHFSVPRPALAFRIGVSGARTLSAEQIDALRAPVAEILGLVRDEIAGLAATDVAKSAYRQEGDEAPVCALSIVSPLAEGADRIVAEEGGKIGAELRVPLPFEKAQFEQDFPKTVDAFRKLLEVASVLTLDGDRADAFRDDSYVENGRFVVRNCDLLIAIWDGEKEKGRGGAGEIVRFAANMGLPVWWIDKANVAKPRFILRSAHLNAPDRAPSADQARDALRFYLRQSILPPKALPPEREGALGLFADRVRSHWAAPVARAFEAAHIHLRRMLKPNDLQLGGEERLSLFARKIRVHLAPDATPLQEYLAEKPASDRLIWRAYSKFFDILAPAPWSEMPSLLRSESELEHYWESFYRAADQLSRDYGARYRSSYVLIAILAVVGLAMAAIAGEATSGINHFVLAVEVLAWIGIGFVVVANLLFRWHERWLSYRLIAELCRKQFVLSTLGRALPGSEVTRLSSDAANEVQSETLPREAWIAWYFMAALRAEPFETGSLKNACARAAAMTHSLVAEQNGYHKSRLERSRRADRNIAHLGQWFFIATVVVAILKFTGVYESHDWMLHDGGLIGGFLSAGAGAFVGVRAYAEFSLLARQSARMLNVLKTVSEDLDLTSLDRPLASRQLGGIMSTLATNMMQDISGWAQLFRIKTIESG